MTRALPLALLVVAACHVQPTLPALRIAEEKARAHDVEGSLAAYRQAQVTCRALKPKRKQVAACADALLGEPEELELAGRTPEAIPLYLAIPERSNGDDATAATALYRAGDLQLRAAAPPLGGAADAGRAVAGWTALWRVVTDYPNEGAAADALRRLLEDGRGRDARALADEVAMLLGPLVETGIADNLVWTLADLSEHELGSPQAARAYYDRIPLEYPKSGLRDDARWNAARISKELGDYQGAVARLRGLLATREVAIGTGSYFSVWLDDAELELGKILRDDLHDLAGAQAAFRALPKLFPASILRDDALYELAVTKVAAGDAAGACRVMQQLAKSFPESKYLQREERPSCP